MQALLQASLGSGSVGDLQVPVAASHVCGATHALLHASTHCPVAALHLSGATQVLPHASIVVVHWPVVLSQTEGATQLLLQRSTHCPVSALHVIGATHILLHASTIPGLSMTQVTYLGSLSCGIAAHFWFRPHTALQFNEVVHVDSERMQISFEAQIWLPQVKTCGSCGAGFSSVHPKNAEAASTQDNKIGRAHV